MRDYQFPKDWKCGKCGGPYPGKPEMSYARSSEWRASIKFREEAEDGARLTDVHLCDQCRRYLEALLYNWFHDLPLNHNPFMIE